LETLSNPLKKYSLLTGVRYGDFIANVEIPGHRIRNVEAVVERMLDATTHYAQPLTAERLLGWHAALFPTGRSGLQKIIVGN
jgi:hypothetical protein